MVEKERFRYGGTHTELGSWKPLPFQGSKEEKVAAEKRRNEKEGRNTRLLKKQRVRKEKSRQRKEPGLSADQAKKGDGSKKRKGERALSIMGENRKKHGNDVNAGVSVGHSKGGIGN